MKTQPEILGAVIEKLEKQGVVIGETAVTKSLIEKAIKSIDETRKEDLIETGKTKIPDIGTLEVRYRASREGRNPRTKETITIPETLTAGLSVSTIIKKEIEEKVQIEPYREAALAKANKNKEA